MNLVRFPVALVVSLSLTGCATFMQGAPKSDVAVSVSSPIGQPSPIEARYEAIGLFGDRSPEDRGIASTSHFVLSLSKRSDYKLTVMAPRYEAFEMRIGRRINPWWWGNAAVALSPFALALLASPFVVASGQNSFGLGIVSAYAGLATVPIGLIGFGVDAANGSMWNHEPDPISVKLFPARP